MGRRRERLHLSMLDELPALLRRLLCSVALVALLSTATPGGGSRYLPAAAVGALLILFGRIVTTSLIVLTRRRGWTGRRAVVVGGEVLGAELVALLARYPRYGLTVVGVVDDDPGCVAAAGADHLGPLAGLVAVVRTRGVQAVLVAPGGFAEEALAEQVVELARLGCDLLPVPRLWETGGQFGADDHIASIPVTRLRVPRLDGPQWWVKRVGDLVVAATALVLLSPLLAACALAVRLEGGPRVLFRQERVGRHGRLFACLKFRTLAASAQESDTRWSVDGDPRIGRVGRVLRRTCLDELPQLWNVVLGDMSLVGPRPERPYFVREFTEELPRYRHRHRVPAGITGLAQVNGLRGDTSIQDRARFDNYYVENWSLWLDVTILLRTVAAVLFARAH
jgi:exopolysaccharide biosynthesis polyprenyl glycosylphosphotransferase